VGDWNREAAVGKEEEQRELVEAMEADADADVAARAIRICCCDEEPVAALVEPAAEAAADRAAARIAWR